MAYERGDLERLYSQCRQQLFTCALAISGSPARAEDAVHDAFCELLRREPAQRAAVVDLKAYAFRAVRNAAVDQVRRRGRATEPLPEYVFDAAPDASAAAEAADSRQSVVAALARLSPDERETIVERLYGQLTFQQIATVREAPLGTVTSWYRRGLEKLRHELEVADGSA